MNEFQESPQDPASRKDSASGEMHAVTGFMRVESDGCYGGTVGFCMDIVQICKTDRDGLAKAIVLC